MKALAERPARAAKKSLAAIGELGLVAANAEIDRSIRPPLNASMAEFVLEMKAMAIRCSVVQA